MTAPVSRQVKDDNDPAGEDQQVKYTLPDAFAELTMANCLFVCGHTYNVGRLKRLEKTWEGKMKDAGKMRFMAYCASQKDNAALSAKMKWKTDPTIAFQHVHTISRLSSVMQPGREKNYTHDWNMSNITVVDPPIFLPKGVGLNGRFANENKNPRQKSPFSWPFP